MDNFNKIISFILGLIVVIVFIVILARRGTFSGTGPIVKNVTPTVVAPTPIKIIAQTVSPTPIVNINYKTGERVTGSVTTIPNTGAETMLIPLVISALGAGFFLKRKAK
ncbi:MAG: hypothetical protein WCO06_07025 [Candidatus Roizmanbacteria bacterium]